MASSAAAASPSGSFSRLDDKTVMFNFRLPLASVIADAGAPAKPKTLLVALDNSGSMAGSSFREAVESVKSLIAETNIPAFVYAYNSYATEYYIEPHNVNSLDHLNAGGGTSFCHVFNAIASKLAVIPRGCDIEVVFLTDGQAGDTPYELETSLTALSSLMHAMSAQGYDIRIDAIGFTRDHDVGLLTRLISASPSQGTFQYAAGRSELRATLDSVIGLVGGSAVRMPAQVQFQVPGESTPRHLVLTLTAVEDVAPISGSGAADAAAAAAAEDMVDAPSAPLVKYLTGSFSIDLPVDASVSAADILSGAIPLQLKIASADAKTTVDCDVTLSLEPREMSNEERIAAKISLLDEQVRSTLQAAVLVQSRAKAVGHTDSVTRAEFERLNTVIRDLDAQIDALVTALLASKKTLKRKSHIKACQEMKQMSRGLFELLSSILSGGSSDVFYDTERIAKLLALSYSNVTSAAQSRALSKRVTGNVERAEDNEAAIEQAAESITLSEDQVTDGSLEAFSCPISMQSWLELAKTGDALCLGLTVSRSEACVSDPTQLRIQSIAKTFISGSTFMEAVEFASNSAPRMDAGDGSSAIAGGFDREASAVSKILEGMAREPINAVLPLYISDEHWSVARLSMRPLLGYCTTLSVLGFTQSQVETIPFLALMKLAQETLLPPPPKAAAAAMDQDQEGAPASEVTEFRLRQLHALIRTCTVILHRFPCGQKLKELLASYVADPTTRLPDNFASNTVLLGQLFCAIVTARSAPAAAAPSSAAAEPVADVAADIVKSWELILPRIMEEEIRRQCRSKMENWAMDDKQNEDSFVTVFLRMLLGLDMDSMVEVTFPGNTSGSDSMYGSIVSNALKQIQKVDAERIATLNAEDRADAATKASQPRKPEGEGTHKTRSKRKAEKMASTKAAAAASSSSISSSSRARSASPVAKRKAVEAFESSAMSVDDAPAAASSSAVDAMSEPSTSSFSAQSDDRSHRRRLSDSKKEEDGEAAAVFDGPMYAVVAKPFLGDVDLDAEPSKTAFTRLMTQSGGFFSTVALFATFGRLVGLRNLFRKNNRACVLSAEAVAEIKTAAEVNIPHLSRSLELVFAPSSSAAISLPAPAEPSSYSSRAVMLAMLAQGIKQRKNTERRRVFEAGEYMDPTMAPIAVLSAIGNAEIEVERKRREAELASSALHTAVSLFCNTDSLEEAAGILRKEAGRVASPQFAAFKTALQTKGMCSKHALEKLHMLLSGSYMPAVEEAAASSSSAAAAVPVLTKSRMTASTVIARGWQPSSSNVRHFVKALKEHGTEDQFVAIFAADMEQHVRAAFRGVQTLTPRPLPPHAKEIKAAKQAARASRMEHESVQQASSSSSRQPRRGYRGGRGRGGRGRGRGGF